MSAAYWMKGAAMITRSSLAVAVTAASLIAASPLFAATQSTGGAALSSAYQPTLTYTGQYVPNMLYYRNSPAGKWQRGLKGLYSKGLSCSDALRNFGRTGRWWGHLMPDGSCGPTAEPSEWALGNRLNFEAGGSQ
jgi:hypothetical protein